MSFLRILESFPGVLDRLFGMFVSSLVIFLAMVNGSSAVSVRGKFVKLGGSLVRITWHGPFNPSGQKGRAVLIFRVFNLGQSRWSQISAASDCRCLNLSA